jgi:putative transposase
MARIGITSLPPTVEDVERAERDILQGWTMPAALSQPEPDDRLDPLDGGIAVTGPGDVPEANAKPGSFEFEE